PHTPTSTPVPYTTLFRSVSSIMRKLIVSNFVTLDGYYDGKDKNLSDIFEYFHEDYHGDDTFDFYNTERMRAADTLLLSGRTSFLDRKSTRLNSSHVKISY